MVITDCDQNFSEIHAIPFLRKRVGVSIAAAHFEIIDDRYLPAGMYDDRSMYHAR